MSRYRLNGLLRRSKGQEAELFVFILSGNHHICPRLSNHDLLVWLWKVYVSLVVWMNCVLSLGKKFSSDGWKFPFLESLKINYECLLSFWIMCLIWWVAYFIYIFIIEVQLFLFISQKSHRSVFRDSSAFVVASRGRLFLQSAGDSCLAGLWPDRWIFFICFTYWYYISLLYFQTIKVKVTLF